MTVSPTLRRAMISAAGGTLGVAIMIGLASLAQLPLISVPFVTSIVLVMSAPESPLAQPRNVLGGHIISALSGLAVARVGHEPWLAAVAVGLSIAAMIGTGTLHPPAGINAYIMVTSNVTWTFLLLPVALGAALLILFAFAFYAVTSPGTWPRYWWREN